MQAGDKVTVEASVVVFNHPQHRGEAFDMKGQSGEVVSVLNDWKGRVISPTLPVIVACLLYTSPSPRDMRQSRMPSSA